MAQHGDIRQAVEQARAQADRLAGQRRQPRPVSDPHRGAVDRAPDRTGIHHLGLHQRGQAFPLARAEHQRLRADFADVVLHRLRFFREVDDERHHEPEREPEELLGRPRRRDVREVLRLRAEARGPHQPCGGLHQVALRQDARLGQAGGPRRVAENRDVLGPARIDRFIEFPWPTLHAAPALLLERLERQQLGVAVAPHAAVVPEHDRVHRFQARFEFERLVDLLLVLAHHQHGLGMPQDVLHLGGGEVGIQAHHLRADALRRVLAPEQLRLVLADQRHRGPAGHPQLGHAHRKGLHVPVHVVPGESLPDPEILLAMQYPVAVARRLMPQQLRDRVDAGVEDRVEPVPGAGQGLRCRHFASPR